MQIEPGFFGQIERSVRVISVLRRRRRAARRPTPGAGLRERPGRCLSGSRIGIRRAREPKEAAKEWLIARGVHAPALRGDTGLVRIIDVGVIV